MRLKKPRLPAAVAGVADPLAERARSLLHGFDVDAPHRRLTRILIADYLSTRYRILDGRPRLYWPLKERLSDGRPKLCGLVYRQSQGHILAAGAAGRISAAIRSLGESLRRAPRDWTLYALRGRLRQDLQMWPGALADFEAALRLNPEWSQGRAWRGEVLVFRMRLKEGLSALSHPLSSPLEEAWRRGWRAEALELLGDARAARRERDAAVALRPEDFAFYVLRGRGGGGADLDRAVELAPREAWPRIVRAHRRYSTEEHAAAAEDLGVAAQADPHGYWLLGKRAQAHDRLGLREKALNDWRASALMNNTWIWTAAFLDPTIQCDVSIKGPNVFMGVLDRRAIERRLERDPRDAWMRSLRTRFLPDTAQAEAEMARALADAPDDFWLQGVWAVQLGKRDPHAGLAQLEEALRLEPACGWLYARRGEIRLRLGELSAALADFDRCLELLPGYWRGYLWKARALHLLGRDAQALAVQDAYYDLSFQTDYPGSFLIRRESRWALGDMEGAVEDLEMDALLDPTVGWAVYAGGSADPLRAEKEIDRFRRRFPRSAAGWAWRGETCLRTGRYAEALVWLAAALKRDKDHFWAWAWRGEALWRLNRTQAALMALDRAIALQPAYARPYAVRAVLLESQGRWDAARQDAEAFLALAPDDLSAFVYWARLLRLCGRSLQAAEALDALLTLHPGHSWARYERYQTRRALGDRSGARSDFEAVAQHGRPGSMSWRFGPEAAPWRTLEPAQEAADDLAREAFGAAGALREAIA